MLLNASDDIDDDDFRFCVDFIQSVDSFYICCFASKQQFDVNGFRLNLARVSLY